MTSTELGPRFFLAAMVILLVCRGTSLIVGRVHQPPVVGEMIAGVLLGPSLLGIVWPQAEELLFPTALRPILYVVGQVGLVALMFQAGRELRTYIKRDLAGTAAAVSAAGVIVPGLLGVGLTVAARGHVDIFVPGVSFGIAAAFVGVALAITAFPMLVRIINESGLAGTRFGSMSLGSGALDDVVAWIGLAAVLSVASGHMWPIAKAVGGAIIFVIVLILVVRPLLKWVCGTEGMSDGAILLTVLAVLFAAAWFTDEIGLFAVFGAFSVGMVMPRTAAVERITPVTNALSWAFVPMFFTFSGLNTRFSLLTSPSLLTFSLAAIVLAIAGKFGGCWLAARLRGESPQVAIRVAALMNARGLMQLIALNIGLAAHIVSPSMFTSLVLVALVTTFMTVPVLAWIDRRMGSDVDAIVPLVPDGDIGSVTDLVPAGAAEGDTRV